MSRPAVRIIALVATLGTWGSTGIAQEAAQSDEDLRRVIERLEQQHNQTGQGGFVLDTFQVQPQDNDPRHKSMQLSIGRAGVQPGSNAFDRRPSNYLLDPMAPDETPPVGLNLRLQF
jgi:hypothetical protein